MLSSDLQRGRVDERHPGGLPREHRQARAVDPRPARTSPYVGHAEIALRRLHRFLALAAARGVGRGRARLVAGTRRGLVRRSGGRCAVAERLCDLGGLLGSQRFLLLDPHRRGSGDFSCFLFGFQCRGLSDLDSQPSLDLREGGFARDRLRSRLEFSPVGRSSLGDRPVCARRARGARCRGGSSGRLCIASRSPEMFPRTSPM